MGSSLFVAMAIGFIIGFGCYKLYCLAVYECVSYARIDRGSVTHSAPQSSPTLSQLGHRCFVLYCFLYYF